MISSKPLTIITMLFFSLMISACDQKPTLQHETVQNQTITVEHEQGTTEVMVNPKKVIVFNTETLDTLDALGIPVAGLPQTSNALPDFLKQYEGKNYLNVGTLFEPDYEKLSHFAPDLIIAGGRTADSYEKLSEIAPTIALSIDPRDFMGSLTQRTRQLGKLFNKEAIAESKLAEFKQKVAQIKNAVAGSGTALVIMVNGGKMSAYGPGSRFGFVYDELGFTPALTLKQTGRHGSVINAEMLLETNPDWLFVIDRDSAIGNRNALSAKAVLNNALVNKTTAMKKNRIIYFDSTAMYIAGGLQAYSQLLDQLSPYFDSQKAN